ncbi:hypothetical protein EON80_29870 [bacterium]|nr:MAG: hypothetical protein EON80_29870 [bacterium]
MSKLKVEFGDPEHGWVEIRVSSGSTTHVLDADSKYQSFQSLIEGLTLLLDRKGSFEVDWLLEPGCKTWNFTRDSQGLIFKVIEFPPHPLWTADGSYEEICFPFAMALQQLRDRFAAVDLITRVEDDFPFEALTTLLEKVKTAAAHSLEPPATSS